MRNEVTHISFKSSMLFLRDTTTGQFLLSHLNLIILDVNGIVCILANYTIYSLNAYFSGHVLEIEAHVLETSVQNPPSGRDN